VWGGIIAMTPAIYRNLARLAGDALLDLRPYPQPVDDCGGGEERAVYIVETAGGYACYAGQPRPGSVDARGVGGARLAAHLRSPSKRAEWARCWVIPLRYDIGNTVVDQLEVAVCTRLMLPVRNRAWKARERELYGVLGPTVQRPACGAGRQRTDPQ
jgi:hypothetical protein